MAELSQTKLRERIQRWKRKIDECEMSLEQAKSRRGKAVACRRLAVFHGYLMDDYQRLDRRLSR